MSGDGPRRVPRARVNSSEYLALFALFTKLDLVPYIYPKVFLFCVQNSVGSEEIQKKRSNTSDVPLRQYVTWRSDSVSRKVIFCKIKNRWSGI